jgi:hypothetical protein
VEDLASPRDQVPALANSAALLAPRLPVPAVLTAVQTLQARLTAQLLGRSSGLPAAARPPWMSGELVRQVNTCSAASEFRAQYPGTRQRSTQKCISCFFTAHHTTHAVFIVHVCSASGRACSCRMAHRPCCVA